MATPLVGTSFEVQFGGQGPPSFPSLPFFFLLRPSPALPFCLHPVWSSLLPSFPPPLLFLPFFLLSPLKLSTLLRLGCLGERGSGRRPAAKRYLGNFRLKNLASSRSSWPFQEIKHQTGGLGGWVVTLQWHGRRLARMWRRVWVVLHCILFFAWVPPLQDAPAIGMRPMQF